MAYMKGGEEDFRQLRDDYKTHSDSIHNIAQRLDQALKRSIWEGEAKKRFENDWNTIHKPNLMKLRAAVDDMGKEAESRRPWVSDFEKAGAKKS